MIFCVCQLIDKTIEHDTKAFILFIDLKKAYDSVPRATMWQILASMECLMLSSVSSGPCMITC